MNGGVIIYTWSENPKRDMIQHLELLTIKKNCKKLLTGEIKSNRDPLINISKTEIERRASEMCFCIKQGLEYFKNAENADISISPLLIYYGIHSLSKALIISNSEINISMEKITYHGLVLNGGKSDKTDKKKTHILDYYATTNGGLFLELCKFYNTKIKTGYKFYLKDSVKNVPELSNLLEKMSIINSNVINQYMDIEEENNKVSFAIYSSEKDKLEKECPILKEKFICENIHNDAFLKYESENNMTSDKIDFLYAYKSVFGGRYFVLNTTCDNEKGETKVLLNQLLTDYIILFILSNLVRYHQDKWNQVLNGGYNSIVSVLKIYIEIVKRRFPNMILNELFHEDFIYGSPSYLS